MQLGFFLRSSWMKLTNVVWTQFTEIKCFPTRLPYPPKKYEWWTPSIFHETSTTKSVDECGSFLGMDMISWVPNPLPWSAEMLASDLQLDFSISSLPRRNRWRFGDGSGSDSPHFLCVVRWNGFFVACTRFDLRRCGEERFEGELVLSIPAQGDPCESVELFLGAINHERLPNCFGYLGL